MSEMTLEQVAHFLREDAVYWINQSGQPVVQARMLRNYADAINAYLANQAIQADIDAAYARGRVEGFEEAKHEEQLTSAQEPLT